MDIQKYFHKALSYQQNGQLQEAESIYLQILNVQPNEFKSLSNLGVIYKFQGKLEKAIEFYRLAISFNPNPEVELFNLANCLMELEEFNEAIIYFKRLQEFQPNSYAILKQIGRILLHKGQLDRAISYLRKALEKSSTDIESLWLIGNILVRQNRLWEARDTFTKILQIKPNHLSSQKWLTLINHLVSDNNKVCFNYQNTFIKFELTGKNIGVEIDHSSGKFYELSELEFMARNVRVKNPVIVDVGANTGNHLVYFAKVMTAAKVIPIEFHPGSIELLKRNILLNQLDNVDLSKLGYAVGSTSGKSTLVEHPARDFCLNEVVASEIGQIQILPLDELLQEPIDLIKIDVEGLEIEVLEGAKLILLKYQPDIMIEVRNRNKKHLIEFIEKNNYCIFKEFNYWNYSNFYLQPMRKLDPLKQFNNSGSCVLFNHESWQLL